MNDDVPPDDPKGLAPEKALDAVLPDTIRHKEEFLSALPAGYDGPLDWGFAQGAFPLSNGRFASFTDVDAIVERRGNFLLCESKSWGCEVPIGQSILLDALYARGGVTILFLMPKGAPREAHAWNQKGFRDGLKHEAFSAVTPTALNKYCSLWWRYASARPWRP